jgi:serine phosphatase RsbU (regulator of sigma subunit)
MQDTPRRVSRPALGLACALAALVLAPVCAQTAPSAAPAPAVARAAQPAARGAPDAYAALISELGQSTVPLDGPWAFHPGDDRAWAQPGFDDSAWPRILAGRDWESQGFQNLTGFAWYRKRIVVDAWTSGWTLNLYLPRVQDAAEIYWNGRLVGSYGKVPPDPVWYASIWPAGLAILCPACSRGQMELGRPESGELAIRVWAAPYVFFSGPEVGGLTTTPEMGSAEAIRDQVGRQSAVWLEGSLYALGLALVSGIVALLAMLAWLRDRRQGMLLWLAIYMAHAILLLPFSVPGLLSFRWGYGLIAPVVCVEDISLWFLLLYLLRLREDRRLVRWTLWITAVALIGNIGDGALQLFDWTAWPGHRFLACDIALTIPSLLIETWVLVLVAFAFRRRLDAARWLLAIAATLVDVVQAVNDWGGAGDRWTHWTAEALVQRPLFTVAGIAFTPATMADTLLLVAMLYAVWRYETEQRAHQTLLDEEYRNAQELQQVLVPQSLPKVEGYSVSSAYRPAQEVGGDFFQIIPPGRVAAGRIQSLHDAFAASLKGDPEGTLVVVGDVSGKGLKAAMTVALIVGALRSLADTTSDPAEILAGLNRRLMGRLETGFATCVAVRFETDGSCQMASAGHLAPFLNGKELVLPPALPLGLAADAAYDVVRLRLEPGDRFILYTDGLVEARNPDGELFGFSRLGGLVASGSDAQAAAEAAVAFGQEDDVTVLILTRDAAAFPEKVAARNDQTQPRMISPQL